MTDDYELLDSGDGRRLERFGKYVHGATPTADRFGNANSAYSFDGNDWIEVVINEDFYKQTAYSVRLVMDN